MSYHELSDFLFSVIAHIEREEYIQEVAFNRKMEDLMLYELEEEAEEY